MGLSAEDYPLLAGKDYAARSVFEPRNRFVRHAGSEGWRMRRCLRSGCSTPARPVGSGQEATVTGWPARRHSSMPSVRRAARRPWAVSSRTASWANDAVGAAAVGDDLGVGG